MVCFGTSVSKPWHGGKKMSTVPDTPDLVMPAAKSRSAGEAFGVSLCIGAWWLMVSIRYMMPLAGEHWILRTAVIIAAPLLGWLLLLLMMVSCGALASMGCAWLKLGNSVLPLVSSLLFSFACSAIALHLLFSASGYDHVLGALWGMGLLVILTHQMLRKIGARAG
jgi:hypothetical protein